MLLNYFFNNTPDLYYILLIITYLLGGHIVFRLFVIMFVYEIIRN